MLYHLTGPDKERRVPDRLTKCHLGQMSIGLEWTSGCCQQIHPHVSRRVWREGTCLVLWSSSRPKWEEMKAQTRGVQQGKGFKYIPQPETKYKEVSDKLTESQIKIKSFFVNSQKAYCVILKCTPPSRQQCKMDSWLNPSRKKISFWCI